MNVLKIEKFYNLSAPILLVGETGTGKSYLAKKIFEKSVIYKEKFTTLHLASIKEELIESELYGHKKGSFTGASENKMGYLKDVGTGTLFLDEIGELSLESQKKLLYVLEEKKYVPVGGTSPEVFRGRFIFATNKNLCEMVKKGLFREDLFFRLMVFKYQLLPVRDNLTELNTAIKYFFDYYKDKYKKLNMMMNVELKIYLEKYEWRGNLREIKNCIEYMVALSEEITLSVRDLPAWIGETRDKKLLEENFGENYNEAMENFENKYLEIMLTRYGGRVNETAREIKISKVNLINKAKKYQINTLKMRVEAQNSNKLHAA